MGRINGTFKLIITICAGLFIVLATIISALSQSNPAGSPPLNASGGTHLRACETAGATPAVNKVDGTCKVFNNTCELTFQYVKVGKCPDPITIEKIVEIHPDCPIPLPQIVEKPVEVIRIVNNTRYLLMPPTNLSLNYSAILEHYQPDKSPKWFLYWLGTIVIILIIYAAKVLIVEYRPLTAKERFIYLFMVKAMKKKTYTLEQWVNAYTIYDKNKKAVPFASINPISKKAWRWTPRSITFVYNRIQKDMLKKAIEASKI